MALSRYAGLILLCAVSVAGAESPTVYVGDRYPHTIEAIAADAQGNTYVTGGRSFSLTFPTTRSEVYVAKLDSANTLLWTMTFSGKENEYGTAIATDSLGNVYAAGYTTSPNFPLHDPTQTDPAGGFVMKLAGDGSRVLWSTYYGVSGTRISSIAVGPDGRVVIGGQVITDSFMNSQAFVAQLDSETNRTLWEQRYGGTQLACTGGSSCFLSPRMNSAIIALDAAGNIYAAGNTNTLDFPTTPGAFMEKGYGPYLRKFDPSGNVLWSTYLSDKRIGIGYPVYPADGVTALAVGPDGSPFVTGGSLPAGPITSDSTVNPYVLKMDPAGTAIVYSTSIGHTSTYPSSIAVDPAGDAWVNGPSGYFFGQPGADYLAVVNPSGTTLLSDTNYANGSRGGQLVIDRSGRIHSAGRAAVVTVIDRSTPSPSVMAGVANAAGPTISGRVVPGEVISIYGSGLGSQVLVDEIAAPVLYSSPTQINAVVPFEVEGRDRITVSAGSARAVLALTAAQPEIFKTADGYAAALNEDGTINSKTNPAKSGSLVTVWGTGAPDWPAGTVDGSINPSSPLTYLSVGVRPELQDTQVAFAGAAPGMVAGVFQVNVRLPATSGQSVSLWPVSVNEVGSPASVWVAP